MTVALAVRTLSEWASALRALFASMFCTPTLPATVSSGFVMQLGHLEWPPRPKSQWSVRGGWTWSDDHLRVSVRESLVQTRSLHAVTDGVDGLFDVELRPYQLSLLSSYVVQLMLDLVLQLQFFA